MTHKFDPRNISKLDERIKLLPPEKILIELGLSPGHVMVDVGAGAGHFSIPASEIIGVSGRVIAVDTSNEMLKEFKKRIPESALHNIEIIQSQEYNLNVKNSTADFALVCTVLHEIEDKFLFLEKVRDVIKKGGKLAVVEWIKKQMDIGPPLQDRIDASEVTELLKRLDFHDIRASDYSDYFYFVTAVK